MHLVGAVLVALQPVARHGLGIPDVDQARVARRREGRERRRFAFAEVGEDQPHVLARRVTFRRHLAREVRILRGHLDALAGAVELPAVVQAAQRIAFDPAEMQRRAAMRAAIVEHLGAARFAAVERVVLAHDADRPGVALRQVFAAVDRQPELPHEAPRRARARRGDVDAAHDVLLHRTLVQIGVVVEIPTYARGQRHGDCCR